MLYKHFPISHNMDLDALILVKYLTESFKSREYHNPVSTDKPTAKASAYEMRVYQPLMTIGAGTHTAKPVEELINHLNYTARLSGMTLNGGDDPTVGYMIDGTDWLLWSLANTENREYFILHPDKEYKFVAPVFLHNDLYKIMRTSEILI